MIRITIFIVFFLALKAQEVFPTEINIKLSWEFIPVVILDDGLRSSVAGRYAK